MKIAQELIDDLIAHAREEAPNECCGLLGAKDGRATTVYRAENEFASPTRFRIRNEYALLRRIEDAGEELGAIYHSHTASEAYPSQTDVNLAELWPDPLWVICSLAGADPDVRAFSIRDGGIEEVELVVG